MCAGVASRYIQIVVHVVPTICICCYEEEQVETNLLLGSLLYSGRMILQLSLYRVIVVIDSEDDGFTLFPSLI